MASCLTSLLSQIALISIFTAFVLSSSSSASTVAGGARPRPFEKIYAFGDSYTDTGNTRSSTGPSSFQYVSRPPYGTTFFHHPTNRYSDGRLVIDFVAETLSLPFLPPYLNSKAGVPNGVNFAVAGATAIPHDFYVKNNLSLNITPQSLQTQLLWFNKLLESRGCRGAATPSQCAAVFDDALIWLGEIGANDYAYSVTSSVAPRTIEALSIRSVVGFLEALLEKGAKYIVVQGLPATGCLPLAMTLAAEDDRDDIGCAASVNKQSFNHNAVLQSKLQHFRRKFPQAVIVYADFWNAYHTVMKSRSEYGFTEPFKACCGAGGPYNFIVFEACGSPSSSSCPNPSQYINWDGVHLTEAMYKVVADSIVHGQFSHPPFKYLLSRKQHPGALIHH